MHGPVQPADRPRDLPHATSAGSASSSTARRTSSSRRWRRRCSEASKALQFEKAARLRDEIKALQNLNLRGDLAKHAQPEVFYVDPRKGLKGLKKVLELESMPRTIDGVDIAHLGGTETVGSLVTFIDGLPFKPGYRRYKIKSVQGVDDFASIREVVSRRIQGLQERDEPFPDIFLIDGGKGQLSAALDAFEALKVTPPTVISLAKREEEIYVPGRSDPIVLSRRSFALRLLQYVRDEAHRFAQHYHHMLRKKRTLGDEDELRLPRVIIDGHHYVRAAATKVARRGARESRLLCQGRLDLDLAWQGDSDAMSGRDRGPSFTTFDRICSDSAFAGTDRPNSALLNPSTSTTCPICLRLYPGEARLLLGRRAAESHLATDWMTDVGSDGSSSGECTGLRPWIDRLSSAACLDHSRTSTHIMILISAHGLGRQFAGDPIFTGPRVRGPRRASGSAWSGPTARARPR